MKKILLTAILGAFMLAGAVLHAEEKKAAEEPYDEDAYGPQAPIIWVKPVKSVVFSHKEHTMGAGLACDSCHDEIFAMEAGAAEAEADFTMQAMYDGKYCGSCHDGSTAFAANTRCTTCHIGVRGHGRLSGEQAKEGAEKSH